MALKILRALTQQIRSDGLGSEVGGYGGGGTDMVMVAVMVFFFSRVS